MFMLILFYFMSNLIFLNYKKYILLNLISLEIIMISNCNIIFNIMKHMNSCSHLIYFLVFFISEGIIGLTMMILMIQFHGNDKMKFLNLI